MLKLEYYFHLFLSQKWTILLVLCLTASVTLLTYSKGDKLYSATARFMLSASILIEPDVEREEYYQFKEKKILNNYREIIESFTRDNTIFNKLDMEPSIGPNLINISFLKNESGEENGIVEISCLHSNPQKACDLANEACKILLQRLKQFNIDKYNNLISDQKREIARISADLSSKEEILRSFKESNGIIDYELQAKAILQQRNFLEQEMLKTLVRISQSSKIISTIEKQMESQDAFSTYSATYTNRYREKITELKLERAMLNAQYVPEHPYMSNIDSTISTLQRKAKEKSSFTSKNVTADPLYSSLSRDLTNETVENYSLGARSKSLKKSIGKLQSEIKRLPGLEIKLMHLENETNLLIYFLQTLRLNLEETKILRNFFEQEINFLELAEKSTPVFGHVGLLHRFSHNLLLALLCTLILFVLLDYFNKSVKFPETMEKSLRVALLGVVPFTERNDYSIDMKMPSGWMESFRAIRERISNMTFTKSARAISVCSALKDEGKTTVALNLALAYALTEKSVILVDCDLRKPSIHKYFKIEQSPGLSDYLRGNAAIHDILRPAPQQDLLLITAGESCINAPELLGSERLEYLISYLRNNVAVIIFDSPPLFLSDALQVATVSDGCIIVGKLRSTPLKAMKGAIRRLKAFGIPVMGSVLNGVSYSGNYYPYNYNYEENTPDKNYSKFSLRKLGLRIESGIIKFFRGKNLNK